MPEPQDPRIQALDDAINVLSKSADALRSITFPKDYRLLQRAIDNQLHWLSSELRGLSYLRSAREAELAALEKPKSQT